jgi:hypothetical protein
LAYCDINWTIKDYYHFGGGNNILLKPLDFIGTPFDVTGEFEEILARMFWKCH